MTDNMTDNMTDDMTDNIEQKEYVIEFLIKQSSILNFIHQYIVKKLANKIISLEFVKNLNSKLFIIPLCLIVLSSLIGYMTYYMMYMLYFFSSIKCLLWIASSYQPDDNTISTTIEYYTIPIILSLMYPFTLLPFIGGLVNLCIIGLGIFTITHNQYRKKICIMLKDIISNKKSEIYKFLLVIDYLLDMVFRIGYNIIYNFSSTYSQLDFSNNSRTVLEGLEILTREVEQSSVNDLVGNIGKDDRIKEVAKINKKAKKIKLSQIRHQSDDDMTD